MDTAIVPQRHGDSAGAQRSQEDQKAGVYVHFPWCLQKCGYCDFLSVKAPRESIDHEGYARAVVGELSRRLLDCPNIRLSSVFFGGGTPSLWEPAELGRVLRAIREGFFASRCDLEITVECNPSSLDEGRARVLLDAGVTRLSIGIQSLDTERLAFLGRLHDAAGGLAAIDAAVRAGFRRVSADLIFGVAGQSPESAAAEVRAVADHGVTHLSAYALTVEPQTAFGALARKGRLPLLPEEKVADSFVAVHEALTDRGFEHYEISNYAKDGARAEHNLGYWYGRDYVGLGCGAFGTLTLPGGRVRYRNTPVPERYLGSASLWPTADILRAGSGELVSELERLTPETDLTERLMLGLRLSEGIDVDAAAAEVGATAWTDARLRSVERLVARGRLVREGSRLRIPYEAWLLADATIASLL
ncbi:MAG TPA: radical SAM family heme chaperone HemW [Polyangiaceae bacterium]|jgi:oxygen-independent coproporphyrinogen-3 oxidase|nr:radical SAM family heme chaperone HemW [Polyangiaceae bacterium]